mmetsp:Transcript_75703/g.180889  ORF Transcript_75703/g.180889 Transcript_75703/m.180889 type:complete len:222 (+) Transcript_75703:260-925(+)
MPSFRDTTMNCECGKWVRIMWPMFCVWLRSNAESISSRMYMGAGLKSSSASTSDSASSERWPPLSSVKLCFQAPWKATLISRPSVSSMPWGGSSLALVFGSSVLKMESKSLFTFFQVRRSVSVFFSSKSLITFSILPLSFRMMSRLDKSSWYSFSALSNITIAFLLMFLPSFFCSEVSCSRRALLSWYRPPWKSKSVPFLPNRACSFWIHGCSFSMRATTM